MVNCLICNGNEFEIDSGARVCVECGAHEQNFVELEDDEAAWEPDYGKYKKFIAIRDEKTSTGATDFTENWTTFEAMNNILVEWVEALIHLGCSDKLRKAAFTLWAMYLKKRNIAFTEELPGNDHLDILPIRDIEVIRNINLEKPRKKSKRKIIELSELDRIKKKVRRKKLRNNDNSNLVGFVADHLSQTLNTTNLENGFVNVDEENDNSTDTESIYERSHVNLADSKSDENFELDDKDDCSIIEEPKEKIEIKTNKQNIISLGALCNRYRLRTNPGYLTTHKLLAILYLAILICEEDVLLLDLLRWCREGFIPYFSTGYLLHPKMKLELKEYKFLFNLDLPQADFIQLDAGKMAVFLSLQAIPLPPFDKTIEKMVAALNLPDEVYSDALKCSDLFFKSNHKVLIIPRIEIFCASCILLTLKVTYGLDDQHENLLSEFADKMNRIMTKENKAYRIFSWKKWQNYINELSFWLSEVDVSQVDPSDRFTHVDSKRYNNYFWTHGIWKLLRTQSTNSKNWERDVTEYLLQINGKNIEQLMSQEPIFKATQFPLSGKVSHYVNEGHFRDSSSSKNKFLKIAKKLASIKFSAHKIHWLNSYDIQYQFRKMNKSILIRTVSLSSKEEVFTASNDSKRLINGKPSIFILPDPSREFWIYDHQQYLKSNNPSTVFPESFLWLAKVLSNMCECSEKTLLKDYALIEAKYLRRLD